MSRAPESDTHDSWIVNDVEEDEGDISWAEGSEPSETEAVAEHTYPPEPRKKRTPERRQTTRRPSPPRYESDFIMPSLDPANTQQRRSKQSRHQRIPDQTQNHTPIKRESASRNLSARSTPARQSVIRKSEHEVSSVLIQVMDYILDIAGSTLKKLKGPISWVLAAYLFAGGMILLQNFLTSSISAALSPICRIPGVSYLHLPICTYSARYPSEFKDGDGDLPTIQPSSGSKDGQQSKPEFDTLMQIQSQFDTLLTESTSQSAISLPLDMKRSETSIRDLRQIVRFSTIPSKNELLHEFDGFIETARLASYDLQKFNSHVGRAVDNVLSTARWTSRVLDEIETDRTSRGLLPAFIQDNVLAPFQPLRFNEARVLEQYIVHARMVSDEIARLIDEAQALLLILANLEDRLDVIHGVSLRDNLAAKADKDEILSHLWTFFGGNKKKLGKVDNQLKLLNRVTEYRKMAYAHVSSTILKLQGMGAELEELRSRVGAAEVLRGSSGISGRGSVAVPLSVHLEAIRMGVERLEGQREKARDVERGYTRRVMDAAAGGGGGGGKDDKEPARLLVDA